MSTNQLPHILKQLRDSKGLTQEALAQSLNIVQSTYSGYEKGYHFPGPDMLQRIAAFYGIEFDVLMKMAFPDFGKDAKNGKKKASSSFKYDSLFQGEHTDTQKVAAELSQYLEYSSAPENKQRLHGLTDKEITLLYCFDQLSKRDQDDFIAFMKIRMHKQ